MSNPSPTNNICPSLGLLEDADSSHAFPSNLNYCHHNQPACPVQIIHQEEFCLSGKYQKCPVFLRQQKKPSRYARRVRANKAGKVSRRNIIAALIILIVAILGLYVGKFSFWTSGQTTQAATASVKPAAIATIAPTEIVAATPKIERAATLPAPFGSSAITNTPAILAYTLSPTAIPTSILFKRRLDFPIGTDYKFVIHKAKGGERLEEFAQQYNTTVAAMLSINYDLTNPAWADVLFVIPVGFSNVEGLPIFVVYQIKEEERGISADSLAQKLRVNPFDLKYYNGLLVEGERPLVGDLILVPWPRSIPTIHWDEPDSWDK